MKHVKLPTNIRPPGPRDYHGPGSKFQCSHPSGSVDLIRGAGRSSKVIAAFCRACGTGFPKVGKLFIPMDHRLFDCEHCESEMYVDPSFRRLLYCSAECADQASIKRREARRSGKPPPPPLKRRRRSEQKRDLRRRKGCKWKLSRCVSSGSPGCLPGDLLRRNSIKHWSAPMFRIWISSELLAHLFPPDRNSLLIWCL